MARRLEDQIVVISGAGSGIGRAAARMFAERGSQVVVGSRSTQALDEIAAETEKAGRRAATLLTDVSKRDQVENLAKLAVEKFGRIDTWVNNAGVSVYSAFDKITEAEVRRIFDVNFMGTVYGIWTAVPILRANGGGTIINVASVVGKRAFPLQNFYSASKHAVVGISDAIRVELMHAGGKIKLSTVCPPSVNTPFYDNALSREGYAAKPLPLVYEPERVAKDIVKCAKRARREVWVGMVTKAVVILNFFGAGMFDRFLSSVMMSQFTTEPKDPTAPSDLFGPTTDTKTRSDWTAWGNRSGAKS